MHHCFEYALYLEHAVIQLAVYSLGHPLGDTNMSMHRFAVSCSNPTILSI